MPPSRSTNKPYKVYRQGRRAPGDGSISWDDTGGSPRRDPGRRPPRGPKPKRSGGRRWFRRLRRTVYVLAALAAVWLLVAFIAFRSAVQEANERVPASAHEALSPTNGPALTTQRNILLVGSDVRPDVPDDPGRADTLIVIHVDAKERRFAMLSIPRDLLVDIPGHGEDKINAAWSLGGDQDAAALTIDTVEEVTGLPIHHYAEINFEGFRTLIDDIGGIDVFVERPVVSAESFDGRRWAFARGELHLDGRRALAYSRIRKNALDPTESDLTRAYRQQQVIDAVAAKVLSARTLLHPRDVPFAIVGPLTTDISASQMVAFAIAKWFATEENTLRCRLGGSVDDSSGVSYIRGDEENRAVVQMFLGEQPPVMPNLAVNPFAPGCATVSG